jgi:hypothetical protein
MSDDNDLTSELERLRERGLLEWMVAGLREERDILRNHLLELEKPPIVPSGYLVESEGVRTIDGRHDWGGWGLVTTNRLRIASGTSGHKKLAQALRALAWAIDNNDSPQHADKGNSK